MAEFSLMPSAAFSPAHLPQEPALSRASKELQTLVSFQWKRQHISRSGSLQLCKLPAEEQGQSLLVFPDDNKSYGHISVPQKPVLIDVQDSRPESVLFSFGIAEQCNRHDKILKFLLSGSNATGEFDLSLLSELMGLAPVAIGMSLQPFIPDDKLCLYEIGVDELQRYPHPEAQFNIPHPILDFVGNLLHTSVLRIDQNGHVLFTGSGAEVKGLLSVVGGYNSYSRSPSGSKVSILVPYFDRKVRGHARANKQMSQTQTVVPLKSPDNLKLKAVLKKKHSRKAIREHNLYQRSYFHACEALLSVLLNRKKADMTIYSLKKSGPEITQLLTQFSIGIAGTGLAVLLSIVCKMPGRRVPFSSARLLNTGFGFGLFWLSWAVNGLRDTISHVFKNSGRMKLKEEEIAGKFERSVNDILFRAAALVALAALRFVA